MTTPNKLNARQLLNDDPIRYSLMKSGAVYDNEKKQIVTHTGESPYQLTSESSRQIWRRRKEKALIAHLRGLAAKEGVALPADVSDEDILKGALDGVEALTAHMKKVFLASTNIRGLAEAYGKITAPLLGQPDDSEDVPFPVLRGALGELAQLARAVEEAREKQLSNNGPDDVITIEAE